MIRVFGPTHTVLRSSKQYKPILKLTTTQYELLFLQAGIPDDQLMLALEPESAAIYCKDMALRKTEGIDGILLKAFNPGQKYIVVDCGGMWTFLCVLLFKSWSYVETLLRKIQNVEIRYKNTI